VRIKLYKIGGASDTGTKETLIQTDSSVAPDGKKRLITLNPKQPGLHKIVISDGGDKTQVSWEKGIPMTFCADGTKPAAVSGTFCFYVPKGTKTLGFFCNMHRGGIISPDGKQRFKFRKTLGFHSIPVPEELRGKPWQLQNVNGRIGLMTVPPYLAIKPAGLLLPEETVKKDQP